MRGSLRGGKLVDARARQGGYPTHYKYCEHGGRADGVDASEFWIPLLPCLHACRAYCSVYGNVYPDGDRNRRRPGIECRGAFLRGLYLWVVYCPNSWVSLCGGPCLRCSTLSVHHFVVDSETPLVGRIARGRSKPHICDSIAVVRTFSTMAALCAVFKRSRLIAHMVGKGRGLGF
jgi:hypothetical protein